MRHVISRDRGTRQCYKKVPCQTGIGFTHVPDGVEEFDYEVSMDAAGLHKIVLRAASNERGVSVRGPLKVRITNRKKI